MAILPCQRVERRKVLLTWENEGVKANILPESRSTFQVDELAVWSQDLTVEVGGHGVVSHTGSAALRLLADRTGLTAALSKALRRRGFTPVHDRGGRVPVVRTSRPPSFSRAGVRFTVACSDYSPEEDPVRLA